MTKNKSISTYIVIFTAIVVGVMFACSYIFTSIDGAPVRKTDNIPYPQFVTPEKAERYIWLENKEWNCTFSSIYWNGDKDFDVVAENEYGVVLRLENKEQWDGEFGEWTRGPLALPIFEHWFANNAIQRCMDSSDGTVPDIRLVVANKSVAWVKRTAYSMSIRVISISNENNIVNVFRASYDR